jgi:hypothetical protein
MAPTNRLIEARRAELRAQAHADKQRETKSQTGGGKRQGTPAKTRDKAKG